MCVKLLDTPNHSINCNYKLLYSSFALSGIDPSKKKYQINYLEVLTFNFHTSVLLIKLYLFFSTILLLLIKEFDNEYPYVVIYISGTFHG